MSKHRVNPCRPVTKPDVHVKSMKKAELLGEIEVLQNRLNNQAETICRYQEDHRNIPLFNRMLEARVVLCSVPDEPPVHYWHHRIEERLARSYSRSCLDGPDADIEAVYIDIGGIALAALGRNKRDDHTVASTAKEIGAIRPPGTAVEARMRISRRSRGLTLLDKFLANKKTPVRTDRSEYSYESEEDMDEEPVDDIEDDEVRNHTHYLTREERGNMLYYEKTGGGYSVHVDVEGKCIITGVLRLGQRSLLCSAIPEVKSIDDVRRLHVVFGEFLRWVDSLDPMEDMDEEPVDDIEDDESE